MTGETPEVRSDKRKPREQGEQREQREKREKKGKKGEKNVMTMQKISLFTFTEIVPSPSRSKRPNAARISCSFAPENLFFVFLLFFYHFTLNLRSYSVEKFSGVSDPLPISSLFFKMTLYAHSLHLAWSSLPM